LNSHILINNSITLADGSQVLVDFLGGQNSKFWLVLLHHSNLENAKYNHLHSNMMKNTCWMAITTNFNHS